MLRINQIYTLCKFLARLYVQLATCRIIKSSAISPWIYNNSTNRTPRSHALYTTIAKRSKWVAFPEACVTFSILGVGRRAGEVKASLDFEILYFPFNSKDEKCLSISSEMVKWNFTNFPLEKIHYCPSHGKNISYVHAMDTPNSHINQCVGKERLNI